MSKSESFSGELEYLVNLADAFELFAKGCRYPDAALVEGVVDGSFASDLADALVDGGYVSGKPAAIRESLARALESEEAGDLGRVLGREYTRLFLVPTNRIVPLYETIYRFNPDRDENLVLFVSKAAMHAEKCYRDAGLKCADRSIEPCDHISTELEFAAFLVRSLIKARAIGEEKDATRICAAYDTFYRHHLNVWVDAFMSKVAEKTRSPLYRELALLGVCFAGGIPTSLKDLPV